MPKMSIDGKGSDDGITRLNGPTMGTRWTAELALPDGMNTDRARAALEGAVDLVDRQMSTWKEASDLMRLNRAPTGVWVDLPDELLFVLARALEIGAASDGAFDIGLGDIVDAWGFGPAGQPDEARIRSHLGKARQPTHKVLELDPENRRARKHAPLALDLSGIAKGFGVDQMARAVDALDISGALLGLDGEIYARGKRPDGQDWVVAVEKPDYEKRLPLSILTIHDAALATSGDYRHWVDLGQIRLAHTMDRRRGGPTQSPVASVTVLAEHCIDADAWATALLVKGEVDGPELARDLGLNALFILRNGDALEQIGVGEVFEAT